MAGYKNYYFAPTRTIMVSKTHGRGRADFISWLSISPEIDDAKWRRPDGDVSHYVKLDDVLADSCKDLLALAKTIQEQIRAGEAELSSMRSDLGKLQKIVGNNFKDQVVIIDGYAWKVDGDGLLSNLGKIA